MSISPPGCRACLPVLLVAQRAHLDVDADLGQLPGQAVRPLDAIRARLRHDHDGAARPARHQGPRGVEIGLGDRCVERRRTGHARGQQARGRGVVPGERQRVPIEGEADGASDVDVPEQSVARVEGNEREAEARRPEPALVPRGGGVAVRTPASLPARRSERGAAARAARSPRRSGRRRPGPPRRAGRPRSGTRCGRSCAVGSRVVRVRAKDGELAAVVPVQVVRDRPRAVAAPGRARRDTIGVPSGTGQK